MTQQLCTWPVDYSECEKPAGQLPIDPEEQDELLEGYPSPLNSLSTEMVEKLERAAGEFLWNVTNRVFGLCPVEVRPCWTMCQGSGSTFWGGKAQWAPGNQPNGLYPVLIGGLWYNLGCGCISSCDCSLDGSQTITLPGPVSEITRVVIDGETIDPSEYLQVFGRMVRLLGDRNFPPCQDLNLPTSEHGTYGIEYMRGLPVPIGGQLAAGVLANELAKAYCKTGDCQLPERVQTVTRQGVTVGFMDLFEGLDEGRTGIWTIDSWIASVTRPQPFAGVRSPDIKPGGTANKPWRI